MVGPGVTTGGMIWSYYSGGLSELLGARTVAGIGSSMYERGDGDVGGFVDERDEGEDTGGESGGAARWTSSTWIPGTAWHFFHRGGGRDEHSFAFSRRGDDEHVRVRVQRHGRRRPRHERA